jgi:hypothetical protein
MRMRKTPQQIEDLIAIGGCVPYIGSTLENELDANQAAHHGWVKAMDESQWLPTDIPIVVRTLTPFSQEQPSVIC